MSFGSFSLLRCMEDSLKMPGGLCKGSPGEGLLLWDQIASAFPLIGHSEELCFGLVSILQLFWDPDLEAELLFHLPFWIERMLPVLWLPCLYLGALWVIGVST